MRQVPKLVQQLAQKTRGKVLVVGSLTSEQRERSTYHAILQAAQSSGLPCVPYTPAIRDEDSPASKPAALIDHAVDGLAMAKRTGCASVLVVGGGSTVEVGKSIATLLTGKASAETLRNPSTREDIIKESLQQKLSNTKVTPIIAVPTSFHGCVAASSNKTFLTDPQEGSVFEMSGNYLDHSGGVKVVVDPSLLSLSTPMICAEGAISSLARLSDAMLANESAAQGIGRDGGIALGELISSLKYLLDESFSLHDQNKPSLSNWISKRKKGEEKEEHISEQYGAIGCVIGSCISLGGPGITQAMARVIMSNYNLSFGQACGILLPQVINIQTNRIHENQWLEGLSGLKMHQETVDFQEGGIHEAFERVRKGVFIPKPSTGELNELTTSIMMDDCFKQSVIDDNGKNTWTRNVVNDILVKSFDFLIELKDENAGGSSSS
jgi:alcohol dehydrogenase class IV